MTLPAQIAKQLRDVHFGENWTWVNLKNTIQDVTWQEATTKAGSLNTILALVCHMNYYVRIVTKVLRGQPLEGKDKESWDHPSVQSQAEWEQLLDAIWKDAETFAIAIEQFPEDKLLEIFPGEKYGNYYRNITGVIEHFHYHLGQIVVIKNILRSRLFIDDNNEGRAHGVL